MRVKRALSIAGIVAVAVLLVVGVALHFVVSGIARDNLSNETFDRGHWRLPSEFGLAYENVTVPSGHLQLSGWWIPAPRSVHVGDALEDVGGTLDGDGPSGTGKGATTVVMVHGLGSNMSRPMRQWAPLLHDAGYNVLAFDLRNHGDSDDARHGYVTYGTDEADDVAAAVAFVRREADRLAADGERIVVYGASMGAATVLNYAARDGGRPEGLLGVIADSAYASLSFQAHIDGDRQGYPSLMVDWVLWRMDKLAPSPPSASRPDDAVARVAVPLLLMHCSDDERIQRASFDRLVARAPSALLSTWIEECPNGIGTDHHIDGWMKPSYNATVTSFLERL